MNRRTFVKSGFAMLLGMIGLNSIKKQVPDEKVLRAKPVDLLYRPHSHNSDAIKIRDIAIREINVSEAEGDWGEDGAKHINGNFIYKGRWGKVKSYINNTVYSDNSFNLVDYLLGAIADGLQE